MTFNIPFTGSVVVKEDKNSLLVLVPLNANQDCAVFRPVACQDVPKDLVVSPYSMFEAYHASDPVKVDGDSFAQLDRVYNVYVPKGAAMCCLVTGVVVSRLNTHTILRDELWTCHGWITRTSIAIGLDAVITPYKPYPYTGGIGDLVRKVRKI